MEKFIEQLTSIGYKNVNLINVNKYRKSRLYFSAESPDGDVVFIKWFIDGGSKEKRGVYYEKTIGRTLGEKEYPLPLQYSKTCIVSKFVDSIGNIKDVIKRENIELTLEYIENSIRSYINLLDRLNEEKVECCSYSYFKMINRYCKRWAYYSKKPIYRKQLAYYRFVFYTKMMRFKYNKKISSKKYTILGDLNSGNCLCLINKKVKCIDYEKVCWSDPNVDMANYIIKIRHHAKNNKQLLHKIDMSIDVFKRSKYYEENNYKFAYHIFEYIDRKWS